MLDEYRIKFAFSEPLAAKDKATFEAFANHRITADQACRRIEKNNGLDHVSWEQLIANVWWLGYQTQFILNYIVTAETDRIVEGVRKEYERAITTIERDPCGAEEA